jgi:mannose-1-phosphate guanylyltransferase
MPPQGDLHVIVPAGGAGTRLWPLSRIARPKFLLDLTGSGRTLLQQTWDRLAPLAASVTVVTGAPHAEAVAEQLPGLGAHGLLVEPSPRDSMAAIGLATALLARRHPDAVVASFAADHVIDDTEAFQESVRTAVLAAGAGFVCTIGIEPTSPSTAYGYVETADALPSGALRVSRFVEKPDADTARSYVSSGRFRWNAGMFVSRADILLGHLGEQHPRLHEGLTAIAAAWDGGDRMATLERVWPTLTRIAIDHAIAEPVAAAGGVACVPGSFGWDDLGDFAALARVLPDEPVSVLGERSLVAAVDASGLVVTSDRAVTLLGVRGVVVVDTGDALLVTTTQHAQRVRAARDAWHGRREDLL